jgi:3-hydroxyisobutyrate dehydrogenase-like beta-hydroxyacid dehydrogenase
MKPVSVTGLETMGSALARLMLREGFRLAVWNRTREQADRLIAEGAAAASCAAA